MSYDYQNDFYGKLCLKEADKGKGFISFGAILVKDGKVLAVGRNRRADASDRALLTHVDYGIHAEQACIVAALQKGIDVTDAAIYVLGKVLRGENKGALTVRTERGFGCLKCPPTFMRFNIAVYIPHVTGWVRLEPEATQKTAKKFCGNNNWKRFSEGTVAI